MDTNYVVKRSEIATEIALLVSMFQNAQVSTPTVDSYVDAFFEDEVELNAIKFAVKRAQRQCKFFPTYAELLEIIEAERKRGELEALRELERAAEERLKARALNPLEFDLTDVVSWEEGAAVMKAALEKRGSKFKLPDGEEKPSGVVIKLAETFSFH